MVLRAVSRSLGRRALSVRSFCNAPFIDAPEYSRAPFIDAPEYSRLLTKSVQSGESGGRARDLGSCLTTPIAQTAVFTFENTQKQIDWTQGKTTQDEYGRYGNPTIKVLEDKLAAMENGETALFSASGMNSCTTMLMALLPRGGHLLTTKDCYRRTRQFVADFLPRMAVTFSIVDLDETNAEGIMEMIREQRPDMFFSESPTNPFLRCIDIAKLARACKETGTILCIDSTFATPINQRPLELGADLVLHSATKYISGHNDCLAGALVGSRELVGRVRDLHETLGGTLDPHTAYLVLRGMKTLGVRVNYQNKSAMILAQYLSSQPSVQQVYYPGLSSHPDYHTARRQMTGFGGVVSFVLKGGHDAAALFIDSLKIPYIAPSLGGVESLVEQPSVISYWDKTPEERQEYGILDGLVRFSAGVEHVEDLKADFAQAFDKIKDLPDV